MDGILLVAHSSETGNESITGLAERVSGITGLPTAVGFKRYGEPKLRRAFEGLASRCGRVAVVPLFMTDGRYTVSIPANLGLRAGSRYGNVGGTEAIVTGAFGLDPGLRGALETELRVAGAADGDGAVLLGHGSSETAASP